MKVRVMTSYIKYTPDLANDWKQTTANVSKDYSHLFRRMLDSSTSSQLQCKLWMITELKPFVKSNMSYALLAGWYANYSVELLISELGAGFVHNYEFDEDAKNISYIFNKRYKDTEVYKCDVKDVMWDKLDEEQTYDVIINTSCEHMYPMSRFYELNNFNSFPLYVLQSTDDEQWDDHINCVSSPKKLAEQAQISDIRYSGTIKLDNGMNRFMVIGYP